MDEPAVFYCPRAWIEDRESLYSDGLGALPSAGRRRRRDRDGFTCEVMAVSVPMGRVGRHVTIVMIRGGQFQPRAGATC